MSRFEFGPWLFRALARGTEPGKPRGILRVWPVWEALAHRLSPAVAIPKTPFDAFSVHLTRHRTAPLTLPDGTSICRGDPIGEVHVNNLVLTAASTPNDKWPLQRLLSADLGAVALWQRQPDAPYIRALFGVTILAAGAARLGFTRYDRPARPWSGLERFYMSGLLVLYTPEGLARLRRGRTRRVYPQEIWMSRAELLRRYAH